MTDTEPDQPSRHERYDKRVEEWIRGLQDGAQRAAPGVLAELAAAARSVAQRLDDMAEQARTKQAKEEAVPEPAEQSESASQKIDEPSTDPPD